MPQTLKATKNRMMGKKSISSFMREMVVVLEFRLRSTDKVPGAVSKAASCTKAQVIP